MTANYELNQRCRDAMKLYFTMNLSGVHTDLLIVSMRFYFVEKLFSIIAEKKRTTTTFVFI